jgi:hypothetical protein
VHGLDMYGLQVVGSLPILIARIRQRAFVTTLE